MRCQMVHLNVVAIQVMEKSVPRTVLLEVLTSIGWDPPKKRMEKAPLHLVSVFSMFTCLIFA